jgi:hypothetical protein
MFYKTSYTQQLQSEIHNKKGIIISSYRVSLGMIAKKKNIAIKRKISSTFKHSSLYGAFGNEILNLTNAKSGKQLNIFDFMST